MIVAWLRFHIKTGTCATTNKIVTTQVPGLPMGQLFFHR